MKKKFLLKVNQKICDTVLVDVSKLRDRELGKKEMIKAVFTSSKFKKQFSGKEIISLAFSLVPRREINLEVGKSGTTLKTKRITKKEIKPILEELKKGNIKKAEKKTARLILSLLKKFNHKEIEPPEISDCLEILWKSEGFIEKMPEPINSAVLEGTDLDYYYDKGKESDYHYQEAEKILKYLKKSAKEILRTRANQE